KASLIGTTIEALEGYLPGVSEKIDWVEASTPRTFVHYTRHFGGACFGTKFEGLAVSQNLPNQMPGVFHAGSVGIIMSGWLGAMNEKYPAFDVLVNNAGIRRDAIVGMMKEEDWDLVLSTNLKACFLTAKQAVLRMSRRRSGRIIQITSPSGQLGFAGQGNYAAS